MMAVQWAVTCIRISPTVERFVEKYLARLELSACPPLEAQTDDNAAESWRLFPQVDAIPTQPNRIPDIFHGHIPKQWC